MRLVQIINEGLSDVLYHSTSISNTLDVLTADKFRLAPAIGTRSEMDILGISKSPIKVGDTVYIHPRHTGTPEKPYKVMSDEYRERVAILPIDGENEILVSKNNLIKDDEEQYKKRRKKIYYISFSRNKFNDFRAHDSSLRSDGATTIVVDGTKLKQDGYSGRAVDYWGPSFKDEITKTPSKDEMEDRLFFDKPYIDGANKYIKEIHVYLGGGRQESMDFAASLIRKAKIQASKRKIPVYVYDDFDNYLMLNKKQADPSVIKRSTKLRPRRTRISTKNEFDPYIEMLFKDDYESLSSNAKRAYQQISGIDGTRPLATTIHNARSDPTSRAELDKFIAHLRSRNIQNLDALLRYVVKKFRD